MFKEMYRNFDFHAEEEKRYMAMAIDKAKRMRWETESGVFVSGDELISKLCTVPGVGETTAVLWLSIIITPSRFPNSKSISAYCGLDPSLKVSAGKVTSTVKRGGNKLLHYYLNMSANILLRSRTDNFGVWGYNLYKSSGKWKKASNAVARKICVAMFYVNKLNVPFSYLLMMGGRASRLREDPIIHHPDIFMEIMKTAAMKRGLHCFGIYVFV